MKNKIKKVFNLLFIIIFIIGISTTISVVSLISGVELESFNYASEQHASYIYDSRDNVVKTINRKYKLKVTYDELPTQFIAALICAEDIRFFNHDGIDTSRLFAALYNNLIEKEYSQGASTLTQQLIKNTQLSNEKTLQRKIKEMVLSLKLEETMSKEEILTAYSNLILFDGITPGVNNASNKYFGKDIWDVNVIEAASLAALVKSPTKYNPLKYPDNNFERRNLILKTMKDYNFISDIVYQKAIQVETNDLLKKEEVDLNTYPYQAYIDIVYEQVEELTGLNPYTTPMKIYTNLDSDLQKELDNIQEGKDKEIVINDEYQQIASSVIDNSSGSLIAVIGGKDYKGERLLNRAYDVRRQPASTIKPILSYALAMEHLGWSDIHVVDDVPYMYPGTNISVKNVDNRYMGELLLEEALGYSRNTVALDSLQKVINKIGIDGVLDYLESINMLDCNQNEFNMSYGIGGMYNGVTPTQLASAFSIFPNGGIYKKALTIRKIELLNNEVIIPNLNEKRVLSEETAFKMSNVLKKVVDNNYWSMGTLKIKGADVGAKSGTSNFDYATLKALNYPSGACKDIWYAGFSKDYTVTVWTGFDKNIKNEKTFFYSSNDSRVGVAKKILKKILSLKVKESNFEPTDKLYKVGVVRGVYPYRLPDEYTPSHMIVYGYFKKEEIPTEVIKPEPLPEIKNILVTQYEDTLKIIFEIDENVVKEKEYGKKLFSNEELYGKVQFNIKYGDGKIAKSTENSIEISVDEIDVLYLDCYLSYEKREVETSHKYIDFIF